MEVRRIHSLDYLRGVMAFLIMIYHYVIWVSDLQGAATFLGRIGVYGVAVFYILSGLTLYLVYKDNISLSCSSISSFYIRRFFRIYPLLWISMLLTILLGKTSYSFLHLVLSFTGLFGFLAPTNYIGLVTWSIGNELVFYSFFPLLVLLIKRRPMLFFILAIASAAVSLYFAFFKYNVWLSLHQQWSTYVNPLGHVVLFVAGVMIGYLVANHDCKTRPFLQKSFLFLGVIGLFFYPASGDLIMIVQGWNRIVFLIFSCMICYGMYYLGQQPPKLMHQVLANIGQTSYSIYLIHPVIFTILIKFNQEIFYIKIRYVFLLYIAVTLLVSNGLYFFLEKPMIAIGKKLTRKTKHTKFSSEISAENCI